MANSPIPRTSCAQTNRLYLPKWSNLAPRRHIGFCRGKGYRGCYTAMLELSMNKHVSYFGALLLWKIWPSTTRRATKENLARIKVMTSLRVKFKWMCGGKDYPILALYLLFYISSHRSKWGSSQSHIVTMNLFQNWKADHTILKRNATETGASSLYSHTVFLMW